MSVEANKATIRRVFEEFVNRGDFSIVDDIYRKDMIDHQPLPGAPEGIEGVKYTIAGLRGGFSDLAVTIEDMSAHADQVVIHNTWRGTHDGDFLGLAPTGRRIASKGVVVWRLQDGLIAERWGIGVDTGILGQLGVGAGGARSRKRVRAVDVPAVRVLPLLPGCTERWRTIMRELTGEHGPQYRTARVAAEISRDLAWIAAGPDGDLAVYHIEAPDPARSLRLLSESTAAVDTWLRAELTALHGVDPWSGAAGAAPVLAHSWSR